jgi:hypothetical protein
MLTLALPAADGGLPTQEEVAALLVPVSETKSARARAAALAYVETTPGATIEDEYLFQMLCEALRDAEDPRKAFVEIKQLDTFRDTVLRKQLEYLDREYTTLLAKEYPELLSVLDLRAIRDQAESTFLPPPDAQSNSRGQVSSTGSASTASTTSTT